MTVSQIVKNQQVLVVAEMPMPKEEVRRIKTGTVLEFSS